MIRRASLIWPPAALAALAACATPGPPAAPIRPVAAATASSATPPAREVVVRVPVAVKSPCVPKNLPPPPKYPDSAQALREAGGAADRYQLLAAGRILRSRRLAVLEKVVEACR